MTEEEKRPRRSRAEEIAEEVSSFIPEESPDDEARPSSALEIESSGDADSDRPSDGDAKDRGPYFSIGWPPPMTPKRSKREEAEAFFAFSQRLASEINVDDDREELPADPVESEGDDAAEPSPTGE